MISIIICSRKQTLLKNLIQNIEDTISVPYEIIPIDNSIKNYGICKAYNQGAALAKFPYLCFLHEDIRIYTQGWGNIISELLSDTKVGLIGLAGGKYQPKAPSPWYTTAKNLTRINIIQVYDKYEHPTRYNYENQDNEILSDVVTVDGVWLSCRKEIWEKKPFDENTFDKFHFYDLDFSMQIFKAGYRVCVTYQILVEHFSSGSMDRSWIKYANIFYKKWKAHLPISVISQPNYFNQRVRFLAYKEYLLTMLRSDYKGYLLFRSLLVYLILHKQGWPLRKVINEYLRSRFPGIHQHIKSVFTS